MCMTIDIEKALNSNAWPFKEAEKLLKHINNKLPRKGYVLFETGYGPSGLPHIGTFGEVVRTSMVRAAFEKISGMPTKLICFSDDMDGMRKIPDTIPNPQEYTQYIGLPLTQIPDPFGTHNSYGEHMNSRLCAFLDSFNFDYEFHSATECYKNGTFDDVLLHTAEKYQKIMDVMLPTLGEERQKTYSPFLPVSPSTGHILQVPMINVDATKGEITFLDEDGSEVTQKVTGGLCKLQWKPDFGMRWVALEVDFEMYGKDHLANGPIYSTICRILGGKPPHQMFYELFLDENGQKISKSKGNGISVEEWLRYATGESLALFMYQSPQKAKRLYFDVIPKAVDEYISLQKSYYTEEDEVKRYANPLYHIHHHSEVPQADHLISFSLLLNLVSACNSDDQSVIFGYINKFDPAADVAEGSQLYNLVTKAMNYYDDFVKPHKKFRLASESEKHAMQSLQNRLQEVNYDISGQELQNIVYSIGREAGFEIKDWFKALYEVLLGASQGPRFGSFIALFGVHQTIELIDNAIDGKLATR